MIGAEKLDQVFHIIIKQMVKTGQAPTTQESAAADSELSQRSQAECIGA
jgi:hypothetical protein